MLRCFLICLLGPGGSFGKAQYSGCYGHPKLYALVLLMKTIKN